MNVDLLLDVGGTGIKGAACPRGGCPGPLREFPAHSNADHAALLRHFSDILRTLAGNESVGRVAMAFPGPFDYEKGVPLMRGLAKYEALYGVCLPEALEEIGFCPEKWYFINDVSACALGVAQCLPARHRALAVCLGTGAGSAFMVDSRLCTDAGEGVPENGWIYPLPYGASIVDDYLSDRGLRRLSRRLLGEHVYGRFGPEFPIRIDFLDTMEGGNLSLQVHPLTGYIHTILSLKINHQAMPFPPCQQGSEPEGVPKSAEGRPRTVKSKI